MSEAFTAKLRGSVFFSPALQLHFICVELNATVFVWRFKPLGLGKLVQRVIFSKHSIGRQSVFRIMQWEMLFGSWKELKAGRTSWNLLTPNGHGLTGIMPAPEKPCSPASSRGKLRFRLVIVRKMEVLRTITASDSYSSACAVKPFIAAPVWMKLLLRQDPPPPPLLRLSLVV